VIHTRAAEQRTIEILRSDAAGLRVIIHCFSMPSYVRECISEGWWISFAGNVTYPNAKELADVVNEIPDELLLVETDAPYLAPQPVRGQPNQPAFVTHTADFVAQRRGVDVAELSALLAANGARLFGW
jgi:TatD DNase family protein